MGNRSKSNSSQNINLFEGINQARTVQRHLDLAIERQNNERLRGEVVALRAENVTLKTKLNEIIAKMNEISGRNHKQLEEKDKRCHRLESDLQIAQTELKKIKEHLNSILDDNSRFREEYHNIKQLFEDNERTLKEELHELRTNLQQNYRSEVETLRQTNVVLQDNNRLLS